MNAFLIAGLAHFYRLTQFIFIRSRRLNERVPKRVTSSSRFHVRPFVSLCFKVSAQGL